MITSISYSHGCYAPFGGNDPQPPGGPSRALASPHSSPDMPSMPLPDGVGPGSSSSSSLATPTFSGAVASLSASSHIAPDKSLMPKPKSEPTFFSKVHSTLWPMEAMRHFKFKCRAVDSRKKGDVFSIKTGMPVCDLLANMALLSDIVNPEPVIDDSPEFELESVVPTRSWAQRFAHTPLKNHLFFELVHQHPGGQVVARDAPKVIDFASICIKVLPPPEYTSSVRQFHIPISAECGELSDEMFVITPETFTPAEWNSMRIWSMKPTFDYSFSSKLEPCQDNELMQTLIADLMRSGGEHDGLLLAQSETNSMRLK
jgi:hypothetical protein